MPCFQPSSGGERVDIGLAKVHLTLLKPLLSITYDGYCSKLLRTSAIFQIEINYRTNLAASIFELLAI